MRKWKTRKRREDENATEKEMVKVCEGETLKR